MASRIFTLIIVSSLVFLVLLGIKTEIDNYLNLMASVNISATVVASCGNGYVDTGEQCDGSNLNGATCQSLGYNSGTLSCNSLCAYNTSNCSTGGSGDVFYTLSVMRSGLGSGKVTSPVGIDCGVICSISLVWNTSATLTATAFPGSKFASWSGDCTGTSTTCTVVMSGHRLVTAIFNLSGSNDVYYTLTAAKTGSGAGKITSNPSGIDCGVICSVSFLWNTSVKLTATASAGSKFVKWTGACASTSTTCTVAMTSNKSVTATFDTTTINDIYYVLTARKTGSGSGTITSNPSGIDCGVICSVSFLWNTSVTITASPASGSRFVNWTGDCTGASTTCTVAMTSNKSVTATFDTTIITDIYYILAVSQSGSGSGVIASEPSGINCGLICSASYPWNTSVKLTASSSVGSVFGGWTGDCSSSTSTTCTLKLTENRSAKAIFTLTGTSIETKFCEVEKKDIPEIEWTEERCVPPTRFCQREAKNIPLEDWTEIKCSATSTPVAVVQTVVNTTVEKTKEFVQSSAGSAATRTVSTVGLAATGALVFPSFAEWFLILIRLGGAIMTVLGIRKRTKPWGTVYDSVTKQPLDPAYVVVQDLQGKEIASSITDLDGRYGFLLEPGKYKMIVKKTNYKFPSEKLAGKTQDEFYENLYFGGEIEVKTAGEAISQNIPMDPEKFDWNEFAKRNKRRLRFYSQIDVWLKRLSDWFFIFGFITAVLAVIFAPYPLNFIIVGLYILILILRKFVAKPKTFGSIIEKGSGDPLSFAIIRVFSVELQKEILKRVADKYGRYFILIPNGKYYMKIEKKNEDATYTEIFTSDVINVQKGIIREKFKV